MLQVTYVLFLLGKLALVLLFGLCNRQTQLFEPDLGVFQLGLLLVALSLQLRQFRSERLDLPGKRRLEIHRLGLALL